MRDENAKTRRHTLYSRSRDRAPPERAGPVADLRGLQRADALRNTLDLARLADRLGYHRYWVAEHHGTPMLACASPEVLIGPIAAGTERIRVGSGGVMLPHYSPLSVAEHFSILSGLYPRPHRPRHRPRAGHRPADDAGAPARPPPPAPDDFPQQLTELLAYLEDRMPADHPFARLRARCPAGRSGPRSWLLGSSPQSAIWAGELGLPYSLRRLHQPARRRDRSRLPAALRGHGPADAPRVAVA